MPLDLPPDSLGPKPTKKQMELLKRMATPGATVHSFEGVRLNSGGAYIRFGESKSETISKNDLHKFYDWGWLTLQRSGFPGNDYIVSDRGHKVIEKGETR